MKEELFGGGPAKVLRRNAVWSRNPLQEKVKVEKTKYLGEKDMDLKAEVKETGFRELIKKTRGIKRYLTLLKMAESKLIILSVKDTPGFEFKENLHKDFADLGLKEDLQNKHWHSYIAIIRNGTVLTENLGNENEEIQISLKLNKEINLNIISSPFKNKNRAVIDINGTDYSVNQRGLNIVVFDETSMSFIDSAAFDTHEKKYACTKRNDISINKPIGTAVKRTDLIQDIEGVRKRLRIDSYIPKKFKSELISNPVKEERKKYKVRIYFFGAPVLWNSLRSICEAFMDDNIWDLLVILGYDGGKVKGKESAVKKSGVPYINVHEYDVKLDKPDIFITNSGKVGDDYIENTYFRVLVPFALVNGIFIRQEDYYKHIQSVAEKVDYVILEKFLFDHMISFNPINSNKMIHIGNPKFDGIYEKLQQKKETNGEWKKTEGKKVVLWTTDHVWNTNNVTFDLYVKDVLDYFEKNEDLVLVLRPHYSYIQELIVQKIWSVEDVQSIKNYFALHKNMIWDDSDDYSIAYSKADGIITDINSGIIVSSLVLDKPVAAIIRFDGNPCKPLYPEVSDMLYRIDSVNKFIEFCEMVNVSEDYLCEERRKVCDDYIGVFDGKNGQRIKDFVTEKYFEKYGEERRQ